ncbi:hemerythrin family protein [Sulfurimonas sp. C5]|uniref:bacteriohemerythrin n=1 Tax=Sulfurimonas sp. C5 TaxID=3036947 RepID=UPI00245500A2|nr:hemerythrin family protein [Sulfurimonas sp. C5]MDH4944342.1 hemerythrin family protein [Sulfurimonas sp. C5]
MNDDLHLNISVIDEKHDEFLQILSLLKSCTTQQFLLLFAEMIEHTREHFSFEEKLMDKYDFYAKGEHKEEHKNLLAEMEYFYMQAQKLPMFGKSYINDYAYDKFKRHIINIDSQFAMFLKEKNIEL